MTWLPIADLSKGLNADSAPEELGDGVASAGSNLRYRSGFAERFRGMAAVYSAPLVQPYGMTHITVGTARYVAYPGLQRTFIDDGTTQSEITLANNTGAIDNKWSTFVLNGLYCQNNGVNVPQYWTGNPAADLANFPAWPAGYLAGWVKPFKNYIFAGDITKTGTRYRGLFLSSDVANPGAMPGSWDGADPTVAAQEQPLDDTNGTLLDFCAMGDMGVLYKDDALYYVQTQQSAARPLKFGRLPGDTGVVALNCVVSTPRGHLYLTPGFDLVLHSGQGPTSILEGRMRTWLAANMNSTYAQRSFLCMNVGTNEVLTCFPEGSSDTCNKALVWNFRDDTFAIRDLPNVTAASLGQVTITDSNVWSGDTQSWADDRTTWGYNDYAPNTPRLILARSLRLAMFDATEMDLDANFTAMWERTGMHFGKPETFKLMRAVRPKLDASPGIVVYFQFGASDTPSGAVTWQAATPFIVDTDIAAYGFAQGRYLALRIFTADASPWRIRSLQADVVLRGNF